MTTIMLLIFGLTIVLGLMVAIALQYEYREFLPTYFVAFGATVFAMVVILSGVLTDSILATIVGFATLMAIVWLAPKAVERKIARDEIEVMPFELKGYLGYLNMRRMDLLFCCALFVPFVLGAMFV